MHILQKQNIIDYIPQTLDPLITLLEPRVMYPSVNMEQLDELKKRRLQSLKSLHEYANIDQCRSAFWIRYFTKSDSPDCGSCDVCKRNNASPTLTQVQQEIIKRIRNGANELHELSHSFPLEQRKMYLEVLESLIDNGEILKSDSNQLILSS